MAMRARGFVLLRHGTAVADFYDDDQVERVYHPEIEALLRRPAEPGPCGLYRESGPQRVRDLLGEAEAVRLADAGARTIQANVWRPIRGPVERSPLALADASSVRFEDLIATRPGVPRPGGEIYHLAYHPCSAGTTHPG